MMKTNHNLQPTIDQNKPTSQIMRDLEEKFIDQEHESLKRAIDFLIVITHHKEKKT